MAKNENPKVSVLMPAYNAEDFIDEAIESILNQTFEDFEFVIVNDCSTDSTQRIIKDYMEKDPRIVLINNVKNLKLSKTLNKGIKSCRGEYIARMDADDVAYPNRLELQVNVLDNNPDIGIVGGAMDTVDEKGNNIGERTYETKNNKLKAKMFRYSPFSHPTILIRKDVLDLSGYYNPQFHPAEDVEFYFRVGKYAEFANVEEKVLKYRILPKSMTGSGVKNMELKTISARLLYFEDYKPNFLDFVYNTVQFLTIWIMPSWFRIRLFNFMRTYFFK